MSHASMSVASGKLAAKHYKLLFPWFISCIIIEKNIEKHIKFPTKSPQQNNKQKTPNNLYSDCLNTRPKHVVV